MSSNRLVYAFWGLAALLILESCFLLISGYVDGISRKCATHHGVSMSPNNHGDKMDATVGPWDIVRSLTEQFAASTFSRTVYASDTFRFIYNRQVGKVGGTSIQRAYIEPVLCRMFYNHSTDIITKYNRKDNDCLEYLRRNRIWYSLYMKRWADYSHFITVTYLRDVCQRAISSFRYIAKVDPRRTGESSLLSFNKFLDDIHQLYRVPRPDSSGHWTPQVHGLLHTGVRRLDFVSCVKDMHVTLPSIVASINDRRPVGTPPLPVPRNITVNSSGKRILIDTLNCSASSCREKLCYQSLYKVDCATIPCGCTWVPRISPFLSVYLVCDRLYIVPTWIWTETLMKYSEDNYLENTQCCGSNSWLITAVSCRSIAVASHSR